MFISIDRNFSIRPALADEETVAFGVTSARDERGMGQGWPCERKQGRKRRV